MSYVGWAGVLVLIAGLFDMLDGQVARMGNMSSDFGALHDSVLDRYSELVMFLGICYYLVAHHYFMSSLIAFVALIGSMMVSYTRARAEGLGIECKGGLMQRPERVVTVGLAAIACGVTAYFIGGNYKLYLNGIPFHVFETMSVFIIPLTVLAVLTNITAINRLRDAKRTLEERAKTKKIIYPAKKQGSKVKVFGWLFIIIPTLFAFMNLPVHPEQTILTKTKSQQDSFPIPKGIKNELFYLQRTHNINTIICELNLDSKGIPNGDNPVHVFWIRYTEQGQRAELSFIQRVFAYGVKARPLGNNNFELYFVSYRKYPMYLMKSLTDNQYHVFATIANKRAILNRIFVKTNGGSFWSPNVEYIEVKGIDPDSGRELVEKMKV